MSLTRQPMTVPVTICAAVLLAWPGTAAGHTGAPWSKIDPWLRLALPGRAPSADLSAVEERFSDAGFRPLAPTAVLRPSLIATSGVVTGDLSHADPLLDCLLDVRGGIDGLTAAGATVRARVGDVVAAYVPASRLLAVATVPEVRRIRPARRKEALNDISVPASGAATVHDNLGVTGKGAIVAVIDTGIDFHHADFRHSDGSTRIRALLDMSMPGDTDGDGDLDGLAAGGGTEYSEADLNAALADNGISRAATGLPKKLPADKFSTVSTSILVTDTVDIKSAAVEVVVDYAGKGTHSVWLTTPTGKRVDLAAANALDATYDLTEQLAGTAAKGTWVLSAKPVGSHDADGWLRHVVLHVNKHVIQTDQVGHGTHVAAIAAGNGGSTDSGPFGAYHGVAPDADLVVVKATRSKDGGYFVTSDIVAALGWVDRTAHSMGQPYAVNLSLGGGFSPRDGTDPDEVAIDSIAGPGMPGAVAVVAAGNGGDTHSHAGGRVPRGGTTYFQYDIEYPYSIALIDLWYSGEDDFAINLRSPGNARANRIPLERGETSCYGVPAASDIVCLLWDVDPRNNDNNVAIVAMSGSPNGSWRFDLYGDAVPAGGRYDAWIVGESGEQFSGGVDDRMRIESPATARHGIAVGAYVTREDWPGGDGKIHKCEDIIKVSPAKYCVPVGSAAAFSADGPTRAGLRKPEVVAPGQWIVSALSRESQPSATGLIAADGKHMADLGTSMAAPHVAGAAAVLLGVRTSLDADQVRSLLTRTAAKQTESVPDDRWGWGTIDLLGAVRELLPTATPPFTSTPRSTPTRTITPQPSSTSTTAVTSTPTPWPGGRRIWLPALGIGR